MTDRSLVTQPRRPVRIANCSGFYGDLQAVNFVIEGIPAQGAAATTRPDAQAKGSASTYDRRRCWFRPA
jgi:hypothetical protein